MAKKYFDRSDVQGVRREVMARFYLSKTDQTRLWAATGYSTVTIYKWLAGGVISSRTRADLEDACRRLGLTPLPADQAPIARALAAIKQEVSQ